MEINQKALIEIYTHKDTNELSILHRSGELTSDAYDAIELVLKSRGIEPSARPTPLDNNTKPTYSSDWTKFFAWLSVGFVVFLIARNIQSSLFLYLLLYLFLP